MTLFLEVFFVLVMIHAVCDFALQNDFIAQAKNRNTELGSFYWKAVLPAPWINSCSRSIFMDRVNIAFRNPINHSLHYRFC